MKDLISLPLCLTAILQIMKKTTHAHPWCYWVLVHLIRFMTLGISLSSISSNSSIIIITLHFWTMITGNISLFNTIKSSSNYPILNVGLLVLCQSFISMFYVSLYLSISISLSTPPPFSFPLFLIFSWYCNLIFNLYSILDASSL